MQVINLHRSMRMNRRHYLHAFMLVLSVIVFTSSSHAMISVGTLTKEVAKEKYGITMHARRNGDDGIKVWLQFEQKGWLEKFTYAELRMKDSEGKHLLSAMLRPNPIYHRQPERVTTVAFSAKADQLEKCSFLVVCYKSNEGDAGYYLNVRDFLELKDPITEK